MKHLSFGWIIAGYFAMVIFSFLYLTGLQFVIEEKHPRLIDKRWKRILWLMSCLLFIPYLITMAGFPSYLVREGRRFLSQNQKEDKKKQDKKEDYK
ncbi:MAG: hypothetical protein M0Z52_12290 [Actinomycetota bacterium]|nr:hypothetical protein [Nitrospiraceae bacterium]MDA8157208.1 hypothetical protein [Actinomycetota bacterium]